jgi:hypothetical protein
LLSYEWSKALNHRSKGDQVQYAVTYSFTQNGHIRIIRYVLMSYDIFK